MRRLRKLRVIAVLPAAIWLLAQFAMTGIAAPSQAVAAPAGYAIAGLPFSAGVICSLQGTTGETPSKDSGKKAMGVCPWCQSFGKAPLLSTPDLSAALPPTSFEFIQHGSAGQIPYGKVRIFNVRSRAPPL